MHTPVCSLVSAVESDQVGPFIASVGEGGTENGGRPESTHTPSAVLVHVPTQEQPSTGCLQIWRRCKNKKVRHSNVVFSLSFLLFIPQKIRKIACWMKISLYLFCLGLCQELELCLFFNSLTYISTSAPPGVDGAPSHAFLVSSPTAAAIDMVWLERALARTRVFTSSSKLSSQLLRRVWLGK